MGRSKVQDLFEVPRMNRLPEDVDSSTRSVYYKQSVGYDVDGNVLYDTVQRPRSQNGSGWVISYTERMCDFLKKVTAGSCVRVFLYIAHHQSYGHEGHYGFRCSHKHIQETLSLDKSTLWDALKYLKEHQLVNVSRIDGSVEFMVNPDYVTVGTDKKSRQNEWLRRLGRSDVEGNAVTRRFSSPSPSSAPPRRSRVVDVCEMD